MLFKKASIASIAAFAVFLLVFSAACGSRPPVADCRSVVNGDEARAGTLNEPGVFMKTMSVPWSACYPGPGGAVRALRASGPVVIDGKLDEQDWKKAERISGFQRRIRTDAGWGPVEQAAEFQTYVRLLYDDEHLYIGLEMEEPEPGRLAAAASGRDDIVIFRDDAVELFIIPSPVLAGKKFRGVTIPGADYAHIAVNSAGVFRDSMRKIGMPAQGDTDFDSGLKAAASVGEDIWSLEIKIPAGPMGGVLSAGGSWLINIGRARRAGPEWSSWSGGKSHAPGAFRRVVFGKNTVLNGDFSGLVPAAESHKAGGLQGENWIKHWGFSALECEVVEGPSNSVRLKDGAVYTCLRIPPESRAGQSILIHEIIVSGSGEISAGMRVTGPESRIESAGSANLSEDPAAFLFRQELNPHEYGYFYVLADGEAFIKHVSVSVE